MHLVFGKCTLHVSTKHKTIKEATGKLNALNVKSIKIIVETDEGEIVELEVHDQDFDLDYETEDE